MQLLTYMYKVLYEHDFSVLLSVYTHTHTHTHLGIELLGHVTTLCLTLRGATKLISPVAAPFYILITNV